MLAFVLKRGIWFLPTLFIISIVAFGLSKMAPGDPVYLYMEGSTGSLPDNPKVRERMYVETKKKLGLDYPAFYCSFQPKAYPDTLYRLLTQDERTTARMLIAQFGDWPSIQEYQQELKKLHQVSVALPDSIGRDALFSIRERLDGLQTQTDTSLIRKRLDLHRQALIENKFEPYFSPQQEKTEAAYQNMLASANREALYIPKFSWHGTQNQYHRWLSDLLQGDFGYSYRDGLPSAFKIRNALGWTVMLNVVALFLAFGLSIFLGVFMAVRQGKKIDKWITFVLFLLYSLPSFWLATMLLLVFGTPDYGLQLFSILELTNLSSTASFGERFWTTARYMILPVFCLAYSSIAIITLQMRGGMVEVLQMDYIRTAYAKGMPKRKVIWKHAFRNALFPVITILGGLFPAIITGAVIIENIFNIPGMGQLMVTSIFEKDWPVVYVIMILSAILTMVGILLADILYALADPRVRFQSKSN